MDEDDAEAFGVAWAYALRSTAGTTRPRRVVWLALAIPVAIIAALAPNLIALIREYDVALLSAPGHAVARDCLAARC